MRTLMAIAAAAMSAVSLAGTEPKPTMSKRELRTEPPEITHEKLKNQIWSMFDKEDFRTKDLPRRPLKSLLLKTHTRPTRVPGLCRYDLADIEFDAPGIVDGNIDTRSSATGLSASSYFKFIDPPKGNYYESVKDEIVSDDRCKSADSLEFFQAENENIATEGYVAWLGLQEALAAKKPVPLECHLFKNDTRTCAEIVLAIRANELSSVGYCEDTTAGEYCFIVNTNDRAVKVYVSAEASPRTSNSAMFRAKVDGLITLSHTVID